MTNKASSFLFARKAAACFVALTAFYVFFPLASSHPAFVFAHEHFFNTLQIVENFKNTGFPTFDTLTATNDFSIVWGGVLYLLSSVCDSHSTLFFIILRAFIAAVGWAGAFLMHKLAHRLDFSPSDAVWFFTDSLFALMYLSQAACATGSFLAVSAVLLSALCLMNMLEKPCFLTGLAGGLSLFFALAAQFDAALFVLTFALVFYFQFNGKIPVTYRQFFAFLPGLIVGLLPLYAWTAFFTSYFGSAVPSTYLSWMNVKSFEPWNLILLIVWNPVRHLLLYPTQLLTLLFPVATCVLTAMTSFPKDVKKQTPKDTLFLSLLYYPLLQLAFVALFTYVDLPEYAFYPLTVGTPFAVLFVFKKLVENIKPEDDEAAERRQMNKCARILSGFIFLIAAGVVIRPQAAAYLPLAEQAGAFARQNANIYAMGKGAGLTSYLTKTPLVRIDGLAANRETSLAIRRAADLTETLKKNGAEYYIGLNVKKAQCFTPEEPSATAFGPTNKAMTGWFCAEPVYQNDVYPKVTLSVFKL